MAQYTTTSFQRIEGSCLGEGETTEYRAYGETIAYVDYSADRTTAVVVVFNPYKGGRREYSSRPAAKAEAIAIKHCTNY